MPNISTGSQIFDICFHPSESRLFVGLLSGGIKAFAYDEQGQSEEKFSTRPSKRSCRGLTTSVDGSKLYAVGKAKAMFTLDTTSGKVAETRAEIHESPINRVKRLSSWMLATGDDDGVVKLWDPRKKEEVRSYTHHFDFISDFMWTEEKRQLVCTSGDGTLSVIDVRSSKIEPLAQSEDQEDELLSIVPIRGGQKTVVGTQQGILAVFNRASGWGDCVDRVPGHPHSIDALAPIPSMYPNSSSTILTGSSDGLLRAIQLFPTKLLGVVADHGDFPIERIAVDREGEGRWVGSAGHDESVRLTDLREVFEDDDDDGDGDGEKGDGEKEGQDENAETREAGAEDDDSDSGSDSSRSSSGQRLAKKRKASAQSSEAEDSAKDGSESDSDSDVDEDEEKHKSGPEADSEADSDASSEPKRRKKKKRVHDPMDVDRKRARRPRNDEVRAEDGFFADL